METKKQKTWKNPETVTDQHKETLHEQNGWHFKFSQGPMIESKTIDQIGEDLKLQFVPAVTFDKTFAKITNLKRNFQFYFHPVDALKFCNYKHRENTMKLDYKDSPIDFINIIPKDLKVHASKYWEDRDKKVLPGGKPIEVLEHISDWSFTTPYKGTILKITDKEDKEVSNVKISVTDEKIPLERLGKDNPILWSTSITLFEDDLEDFGYSQAALKFRTMKDCFYGLNRSYIRVDNVVIRLLETRFFHDYKTNYILRQFSHKEITYKEMEAQGIKLNSDFNIHPQQADIISQGCPEKFVHRDKIVFSQ